MTTHTGSEHHPSLVTQVHHRRDELRRALTRVGKDDAPGRATIETALSSLAPMLTGDLTHPPDMVSRDLVRWLEINKHVGVKQVTTVIAAPAPVVIAPAPVALAPAPIELAPAPIELAPAPIELAPAPVAAALEITTAWDDEADKPS